MVSSRPRHPQKKEDWWHRPVGGFVLVGVLACVALTRCSSLFYYPDDRAYSSPHDYPTGVRMFEIKVDDDHSLAAMALAPEPGLEPIGTVVQFHGNAQNMTAHASYVQWLVRLGFEVVAFDYRGYGASPGAPTQAGLVADGQAVLRYLSERDGHVIVIGQSLGGAVAVPSLVKLGSDHNVRRLVLDSTFSSYRQIARSKLGSFFLTWPLQWPLSYLIADDYPPIRYAEALTVPVFLVHGTADHVVPMEESEDLWALLAQKENTERFIIQGGRHTSVLVHPLQGAARERLFRFICGGSRQPGQCFQRYEQAEREQLARYQKAREAAESETTDSDS